MIPGWRPRSTEEFIEGWCLTCGLSERSGRSGLFYGGWKINAGPSGVRRLSVRKSPEQLVREAERKYLAAIEILARGIRRNPSKLDPETRTKFDQALASIDRTIDATRKAVREHPADPFAAQYMLAAYARKVDVLREIAGAGAF